MSLTSFSVIMAVFTSNINVRGFKDVDLPPWLQTVIKFLAKINCMHLAHITQDLHGDPVEDIQLRQVRIRNYSHLANTVSSDSGCALMECENGDTQQNDLNHKRDQDHFQNTSDGPSWEAKEIMHRLQILVDKEDEKDKSDLLTKRWMEASAVIDRCLFWIFFFGTSLSTLIILVLLPIVRPFGSHPS